MIYLNNSSTTWPKPQSVSDLVSSIISNPPANYSRTGLSAESDDLLFQTRKNLARIFGIKDSNQIIFTSGSTESLNTIIKGILPDNSHVIISATEHNSTIRPLKKLEKQGKIEISIAPCDYLGNVNPEEYNKLARSNTRLMIINHVSNVTGAVQDIHKIAEIAHSWNSLILVDSSQAAGAFQINAEEDNLDFMVFTGHKSLYGIQGIGGYYIRKGIELDTLIEGGTGVKSNILFQPDELPMKLEAGTQNVPGIASLKAGTDFILNEGFEKINSKKDKMKSMIIESFKNNSKIRIINPYDQNSQAVISFLIGNTVPEEINYILKHSFDIVIRSGLHCAPLIHQYIDAPFGTLRVSPSYFTSIDEIVRFIEVVELISGDFA